MTGTSTTDTTTAPTLATRLHATVDRLTLKDALGPKLMGKIIRGRMQLSILEYARVQAKNGQLEVSGDALDKRLTITMPADVDTDGVVLVDFKRLRDIIKSGADTVTFSIVEDGQVQITNGPAVTRMWPGVLQDRPTMPEPPRDNMMVLHHVDLARLAGVAMAAATEEARPMLTGVLFEDDRAVATDSYRMHVGQLRVTSPVKMLVPAGVIQQITNLGTDSVAVTAHDSDSFRPEVAFQTTATFGPKKAPRTVGVTLVACQIEAAFPNWQKLCPSEMEGHTVRIEREPLIGAFARAYEAVKHQINTPVQTSRTDDGDLRLQVSATDVQTDETIHLGGVLPDGWSDVALNPNYMGQLLSVMDADKINLNVRSGLKPITVNDGGPMYALLMPMRVN